MSQISLKPKPGALKKKKTKTVLTDGYQLDHIVLYVEGTLMVAGLVEQSHNKEEK